MNNKNKSNFYFLAPAMQTQELAKWVDTEMQVEAVTCPLDEGHQRSGKRISALTVELPLLQQVEPNNAYWTWQSELLVSESIVALLQESNLSGFETQPITTMLAGDGKITTDVNFFQLVATGWGGIASPESGVKLIDHCGKCRLLVYSSPSQCESLIDPKSWDATDVFMVWPLPRFIFLSEQAAKFFLEIKLNNTRILPLSAFPSSSAQLSPGLLSYWLSEKRLSEVQETLASAEDRLII